MNIYLKKFVTVVGAVTDTCSMTCFSFNCHLQKKIKALQDCMYVSFVQFIKLKK